MVTESKISEWAEKYVQGILTEEENTRMKEAFVANPEYFRFFKETVAVLEAFQSANERNEIKNLIHSVAVHPEEWNSIAEPTAPKVFALGKYIKMGAAAAILICFSSLATFLLVDKKANKAEQKNYTELVRKVNTIEASQFKIMDSLKKVKMENNEVANASADTTLYGGTGFALTNDGYIATNYHVVKDANTIYVQTSKGEHLKAYIVAREPNSDIAILKLEDKGYRFGKSPLPYAIARSISGLGQRVFTIGYPKDEVVYNEGYISCEKGYEGDSLSYQLEMTANPGQSGSPVLDKYGSVVAIVKGKQSNTVGTTYAVHSGALLELIHSLPSSANIRIPTGNKLNKMDRTEQVKRMRDYVVSIKVN